MADIVPALYAATGPGSVFVGDQVPETHRTDATALPPVAPLALVLPRNTDEVSRLLRLCHAAGQPVVVQGGRTGFAGGAQPRADEVAICLERMRGVEEIDPRSATLTALAGTPLQEVQDAAAGAGLLCGIDLGARGSCTIGGNVATNAGGNQVLRYGMTRRNVLGLEVVMADGKVIRSLNKMQKNNAGYDWTQYFIGSEGTLGVVTRVVLGLHPRPRSLGTALVALSGVDDALTLLAEVEAAAPGRLQVFEAMWRDMIDVATRVIGVRAPFAAEHELLVLLELSEGSGDDGDISALLAPLYETGLIRDAVVARSQADRARLWALRESPYEYARKLPKMLGFDISIPRNRISEAVARFRSEVAARFPRALCLVYGHLADSNLHLNIAPPAMDEATGGALDACIYTIVADFGGSVSAEHGIGLVKKQWLPLSRTPEELALMRTIKAALDPKGILNRGRIF